MASTFFKVVDLISKSVDLGATTYNIVMTFKEEGPLTTTKKVDVVVKIVFCVLQTVEIGFSMTNLIASTRVQELTEKIGLTPSETQLILSSAAGVGAIAKTITHKVDTGVNSLEDIINIIGVVIFRVSGVTAQAAQLQNLSAKDKEILEWIGIIATGAKAGEECRFSSVHIYRKGKSVSYRATKFFLSLFCSAQSKTDPKLNIIEINNVENADVLESNSEKNLLYLRSQSRLKIIPDLLCGDSVLSKHICPITKRPIRFAVKPNLPNNSVAYERSALKAWIKDHPTGEHPPQWPEELDCLVKNSCRHHIVQTRIDRRLELLTKMYANSCNKNANSANEASPLPADQASSSHE